MSGDYPLPITPVPNSWGLKAGDTVTFTALPPWWKRLLIWLKVMKRPVPKRFVITHTRAGAVNWEDAD